MNISSDSINGWPSISKDTSLRIMPLNISPSMLPIMNPWFVSVLTTALVVIRRNCLNTLDWITKNITAINSATIKRNIAIGLSTFARILLNLKYNTTLSKQHFDINVKY